MDQNNDTSVMTGAFDCVTPDQVEVVRKLHIIGWRWTDETLQKGVLRLRNHPLSDLPGRHKIGQSILIAEILPNGHVKMGDGAGVKVKKK